MQPLNLDFFGPTAQTAHHEESMTFNIDGSWINLPSVIHGKKYGEDAILQMYKQGKLQPLDNMVHKDKQSAINHAIERSASANEAN